MGIISVGQGISAALPSAISSDPVTITPTGSPFTFTPTDNGILFFSGGTVSLVQYSRNSTLLPLGIISGSTAVQLGDTVLFNYITPPSIKFIAISM